MKAFLLVPSLVFAAYSGVALIPHTLGEYNKPISNQEFCYGWRVAGEPGVIGATRKDMNSYCSSIHE